MSWLPSSPESKQLYGFGVITVVGALLAMIAVGCGVGLRLQRDSAVFDQGSILAGLVGQTADAVAVSAALEAAARNPERPLEAFVVDTGGRVLASSGAADVGQPAAAAETRIRTRWPGAARASFAIQNLPGAAGQTTLIVMSPLRGVPSASARLAVGLAAGAGLALVLFLPFLLYLRHNWLQPLERIADANRAAATTEGKYAPAPIPPASVPPGTIRELVVQRNQVLEVLRTKEEALSRRTSDMESLYEFSREMGLSRQAPAIPDISLSYLARAVDCDVACMLVFSEDQRSLAVRSRAPMTEFLAAEVERLAVEAHYEKSGILLEGEKLDTSHVVSDVRAGRLDGKFRSAHWAPIAVERRQVGVLGICALAERHFSTDHIRFLNILAQNTSLALEKVHVMRVEETQRFRNVLEHLAEGVVLVRQTGEWALATGPSRQFHAEICGPDASGTSDHSRMCPIGLLGLDVFHGESAITREITRQEKTLILSGTFVRSSAAGEQGAVISIRDVTEERATQQQLFQASKLASLGELAAGVAHEVNNPLTGILGFTELLMAREDITPAVLESLQDIHALARRTAQITMDLLIFARVQREGGFGAVDLRVVVRDTIKLLESTYRTLNLELAADMGEASVPLVAVGDQGKIQQIVLNLAQNAKDAIVMASHGSRITFRGWRQKDEVFVEVEDDGPGIPDRIRAKIFEPFYTTKPVGKGTGLGLAIVNRIVEEHQGKLILDSEEGRGTRFRISLPAASAEAIAKMPPPREELRPLRMPPNLEQVKAANRPQPVHEVAPPPAPASPHVRSAPGYASPIAQSAAEAEQGAPAPYGGGGCVVVLDDEDTVLKFVTRTLARDGMTVFATSDPDEARALIAQHRPDLLLLDFRMPSMTGEDFYTEVVGRDPTYAGRVVFLTGDSTGDEIQGFLKSTGATALAKPIGIKDLREFVDQKLAEVRDAPAPSARPPGRG